MRIRRSKALRCTLVALPDVSACSVFARLESCRCISSLPSRLRCRRRRGKGTVSSVGGASRTFIIQGAMASSSPSFLSSPPPFLSWGCRYPLPSAADVISIASNQCDKFQPPTPQLRRDFPVCVATLDFPSSLRELCLYFSRQRYTE